MNVTSGRGRRGSAHLVPVLGLVALGSSLGCVMSLDASVRDGERALQASRWSPRVLYDEAGRDLRAPDACQTGACAAVTSFRFPGPHPLAAVLGRRSFVYDDALALIARLAAGDRDGALALGETLAALVQGDGSIGFSFGLDDPAFYNVAYVRAGAVAWVGYALALLDARLPSPRFASVTHRLADALLAQRHPDGADPRAGLILAGRGLWSRGYTTFNAAFVSRVCVTEHQIDAYFFLRELGVREPRYAVAAEALARVLLDRLWLEDEGRFAVAATPERIDRTPALDAAGVWGALFLLARGETARAARALSYVERTFRSPRLQVPGFSFYAGEVEDHPGLDLSLVCSGEGTAAAALAWLRVGDTAAAATHATTLRSRRQPGLGVPYAWPEVPEFPGVPAAAPTAWLLFVERELRGEPPLLFTVSARAGSATSGPANSGPALTGPATSGRTLTGPARFAGGL